jgi:hypothetical protein
MRARLRESEREDAELRMERDVLISLNADRAANRQLACARRHIVTTRADLELAYQLLNDARQWVTDHEAERRRRPELAAALDRGLNAASSPRPARGPRLGRTAS